MNDRKSNAQIKKEIVALLNGAMLFTLTYPKTSKVYIASYDHDVTMSSVLNLLVAYKDVISVHPVHNSDGTGFQYIELRIN